MVIMNFLLKSEEGVFIYGKQKRKTKINYIPPWRSDKKHIYIVYFRNLKCPACRFLYDKIWITYLPKFTELAIPAEVTCEYFAKQCSDEWAKMEFLLTDVHATPTIAVLYGGEVIFKDTAPDMDHIIELLRVLKNNESLGIKLMKLLSGLLKTSKKEICSKILKANLHISEELMSKVKSACKDNEN